MAFSLAPFPSPSLLTHNRCASGFGALTFSSQAYFAAILELQPSDLSLDQIELSDIRWMTELMAGYVTSADVGNEDLVIASRTALCEYCNVNKDRLELVCDSLLQCLRKYQWQDRVVVPALEIIAFLLDVGLFQVTGSINFRNLCIFTQKASYKTGNVRKIIACIKVYGGVASIKADQSSSAYAGVVEARKRLGALLFHPWPRVRSAVVDEIWGLVGIGPEGEEQCDSSALLGVDWSEASKGSIQSVVTDLLKG